MTNKIFAYCERGNDPTFWAEPINAITNAAFLLAALAAWMLWRSERGLGAGLAELILLLIVAVIGIGSFLFHTYAEGWAALADTIPIGIFMVGYLGYALRRYLGWGVVATLAALVVFFASLAASSMVRCNGGPCLNGSVAYFPAFAVLIVIGVFLSLRGHRAGAYLTAAGLVFAASLTFRTIDQILCAQTSGLIGEDPLGTHFLWHILNATLLYLLLRAAILHGRPDLALARRG